jgi:hypothetical protein
MLTRAPTGHSLGWNTDSIHILRGPSSRSQRTLEVPLCTSAARELLVALGLRLRAIAASSGCPASRLQYYTLNRVAFFVVLVTTVYSVVALQKITTGCQPRSLLPGDSRSQVEPLTVEQSSYGK